MLINFVNNGTGKDNSMNTGITFEKLYILILILCSFNSYLLST